MSNQKVPRLLVSAERRVVKALPTEPAGQFGESKHERNSIAAVLRKRQPLSSDDLAYGNTGMQPFWPDIF